MGEQDIEKSAIRVGGRGSFSPVFPVARQPFNEQQRAQICNPIHV